MSRQDTAKAVRYIILVFVAGVAFGVAASQFYNARIAEAVVEEKPSTASQYRKNLLDELDAELDLDFDQESEILEILDEIEDRFWEVRDAMEPEFEAIRQERAAQVMSVLSPHQRVVYQQILEERRRKSDEERERYRNN